MRHYAGLCMLLSALVAVSAALGDDWPQWRGPDRNGISKEKGLLKVWPEGGPKQLWAINTPGKGLAAPAIVGETIYLTGTEKKIGALYALSMDGKIKWRQPYGPEWTGTYPMARTTPTVTEGCVYLYSGAGRAVCLDAKTGKEIWSVDTLRQFKGKNIRWGIAESPLLVPPKGLFICHPGGPDAAVVALDKRTGKTVWTSKGLGEASAYCSPMYVDVGSKRQIITQTEKHVVGLDAADGSVLWKIPQRNRYAVHANTPLSFDGLVFITCGYRYGSQLIKLAPDGKGATQVWTEKMVDNHFQGALLLDGRIHSTSHQSKARGRLQCLNPKEGKVLYATKDVTKAAIVYAGGRIYAYAEKGGGVFLVKILPDAYQVTGQFRLPKGLGSGPHWAHPVVANGVLYIRHGEAFVAYDVKEK